MIPSDPSPIIAHLLDALTAQHHDRAAALGTLNAILALGYRIEPPAGGAAVEADARVLALANRIDHTAANMAGLIALWHERTKVRELWEHTPELYRRLGERVLKLGAPLVAIEVVSEGLEHWKRDAKLRQIQGLAWARSGASERANRILGELAQEGHGDEQTLGILARTHKDLGLLTADARERQRQLRMSLEIYTQAYRQSGSCWTGINVVTLATLLGDQATATDLARTVRAECLNELKKAEAGGGDRYWALATLGEAALNLNEWTEAESWYRQAADVNRRRFGDLNATRRQARVLVTHLGRNVAWIDQLLPIPKVVVFAGHMIDRPERARPRFPAALELPVRTALRDRLRKIGALVGYASAACGSDILFLETLLELDGEVHVVLPYDKDIFVGDSVDIVPGSDWKDRYEKVLSRATRVVTASNEKMAGGSVSYDYANLVLHGLASVRARELETDLTALAVWDGRIGDGPGGTASVIRHWQKLGLPIERIDLAEMLRHSGLPLLPELPPGEDDGGESPVSDTHVMAMLFADAVGYSKLTEDQVPRFVQHFLGTIAELLSRASKSAVVKNTWGDGVYLVFETVRDAGVFALDLCREITAISWADRGLPKNLNLRIALHAGPVYSCEDPITGRRNYTGTHVSRAARIEPITPAGQVYASQAFAALAALEKIDEFTCEFVKQVEWAKQYGTFPTYVVRPRER